MHHGVETGIGIPSANTGYHQADPSFRAGTATSAAHCTSGIHISSLCLSADATESHDTDAIETSGKQRFSGRFRKDGFALAAVTHKSVGTGELLEAETKWPR